MTLLRINNPFWPSIIVVMLCVSIAIYYGLTSSGRSVDSTLLTDDGVSEKGQLRIQDAVKARDSGELVELLNDQPKLISALNDEIQGNRLDQEWDDNALNRVSVASSLLNDILLRYRGGAEHTQLSMFDAKKEKLVNYLATFVSLKKKQGQGVISGYDFASQTAIANANTLLIELQQGEESNQRIAGLADWYAVENKSKSQLRVFEISLLHNAWLLSARQLELEAKLAGVDLAQTLSKETDLIRLLSHDDEYVVMNAAALIAHFAPENAMTALRFQLTQSKSNAVSFLLLDALKSYGQNRDAFEPQLNKMMQVTRNSELQAKIMETIDHVYGRSNMPLSKSH